MLACILKTIKETKTPKGTPKGTPKDIIISLISKNAKVTVQQMADALGMNKRNAQKHVNAMQDEGLIVRVGPARGGHWKIVK